MAIAQHLYKVLFSLSPVSALIIEAVKEVQELILMVISEFLLS